MGQPTTTLQFANCETAQRFQRSLIARLSDLLSERVGRRRAEAELSHIAELLALELHALRGREDPIPEGDVERLADTLVALKRRIGARFRIVSVTPWQIVLKNSVCPFAEKASGRPALCTITASVFGRLAAETMGFARVHIPKSITQGDSGCLVVIDLVPNQASVYANRGRVRSMEFRAD